MLLLLLLLLLLYCCYYHCDYRMPQCYRDDTIAGSFDAAAPPTTSLSLLSDNITFASQTTHNHSLIVVVVLVVDTQGR